MTSRLQRIPTATVAPQVVPRAALYTRVSTDMQVEAESLGTQEKQLREYCSYHRLEIHDLYTDAGISGAHTDNRPGFQRMMREAREGKFTTVIVAKIDRISRNLADLLDLIHTLEQNQVDFISISQQFDTSTPMGRLTLNILGSFAQFERDIIAERVRENMIERAKKGKWNGGVIPYGFVVVEDHLEPHSTEADFVRMMYAEYLKQRSLRAVALLMNARDAKPRYRNSFTGSSIRKILANPIYRGAACYNKRKFVGTTTRVRPKSEWIIVENMLPAVVTPDTWAEVNRLLENNEGIHPAARASDYLLSGLLRCGVCGMHMQARKRVKTLGSAKSAKKGAKKTYLYYICYNHLQKGSSVCSHGPVPTQVIEERILEGLSRLAKNPDPILRHAESLLRVSAMEKDRISEDLKVLTQRVREIDARLARLGDALEEGSLGPRDIARRGRALRSERDLLGSQIDALGIKKDAIDRGSLDRGKLTERFDVFRDSFRYLSIHERKQILHNLIDHVVVHPDGSLDLFIYQPVVREVFQEAGIQGIGASQEEPLLTVTLQAEKPSLRPLSSFPDIASRIGYLRQREGLTKVALAEKLGVNKCTVANWERRSVLPMKPMGRKIAGLFGVAYGDLMGVDPVDESLPPWDRLRPLRQYHGYTQKEFAKLQGLTLDGYVLLETRPERVGRVDEGRYDEMKARVEGEIVCGD